MSKFCPVPRGQIYAALLALVCWNVIMSLFQFGFSRKKRKEDEREGGRESEDDRGGKEQKVEEISTEKRGTGTKLENKRVRKYQDT